MCIFYKSRCNGYYPSSTNAGVINASELKTRLMKFSYMEVT